MKKFSFTKRGSRRYFYQVLWQFLSSRRQTVRELRFLTFFENFLAYSSAANLQKLSSWTVWSRTNSGRRIFAAAGGKKCSNYFQNRAPARNCQIRLARFGGLGNQIVWNFGRKNQLAVLF